jgi:ribonuclease J
LNKKIDDLRIIPLGGVGEIGKNMTVIEHGDDMILIDCGLIFPRDDMFGVDYVLPDISYVEKNIDKLKGIILTHGHEDHIGAIPFFIEKLNVPIYGTRFANALIRTKLEEHGLDNVALNDIKAGDKFDLGIFKINPIKVSHSIDDAVGYAINTPQGVVVHTGDFKIDFTPIDGKVIDLARFAELGTKGVLVLMADSTNAQTPGYTMSESIVGETFESYFKKANGRIIIATFASNIYRLQQVIDTAKRFNRKVCFTGRSMLRIAGVASELGLLTIDEKMIVDIDQLSTYPDKKIALITTGSQGETMAGLTRMASGDHAKIKITDGDTVIISATPIPGNERGVADVINMLHKRGALVINEGNADVHVSGHACQEELKLIHTLVKPKYFIPVHGEYKHLYKHAELAEDLGIKRKNIFIPEIGVPIEINKTKAQMGKKVPSGKILIDGLGIGDVGNVVLKDRRLLSQDGLFVVIVTIDKQTCSLISGPEIISRGFVYVKESEQLIEGAKKVVIDVVSECERNNISEWSVLKPKIKKALRNYLYIQTKRNPMILPVIIEV